MKLISITKSPMAKKKWRALFEHDGHGPGLGKTRFHTDFGAEGYKDFTTYYMAQMDKLCQHFKNKLDG